MRRLYLAELRDSWTAWVGVSLSFIVMNTALTIPAVVLFSGMAALSSGELGFYESSSYTVVQALLAGSVCLVALPVVSSATSLVVDSRRGSLARLALAGASPRHIRGTVLSQLAAVALASAVIGDAIGLALVRPWVALTQASGDTGTATLEPTYSPWALLLASGTTVVVALIAGGRQARQASAIPPVEALRQSQAPLKRVRIRPLGWIGLLLTLAVGVGSFASVPVQIAHRYSETFSNLLIIGAMQMFIWGIAIAFLGPVLMRPVTRAWTALIPVGSAPWVLAKASVTARTERLYKSVTPVLFAVGILVGSVVTGESLAATLAAYAEADLVAGMGGILTELFTFGLPLAVAFAGSISSLVMMTKQRDADLALLGVAGATPAQRILIPAFEGVIITVTAALLSLGMIAPSLMFFGYAIPSMDVAWHLVIPWPLVAAILLGCAAITVASTVIPTLAAQRVPEQRVIARLVAE
ncbi:MAG: FtsX-like permease family protein [Arachnia sp.]